MATSARCVFGHLVAAPEQDFDNQRYLRHRTFSIFNRRSSHKETLLALDQEFHRHKSTKTLKLLKQALHLLDNQSFEPDLETYAALLKSCTGVEYVQAGQFIHQHIVANEHDSNIYLCNLLVDMYAKCGALEEAAFVFESIPEPNVFSWTMIISAHAHHGCFEEAQLLFQQMWNCSVRPNAFTFSTVLATCSHPQHVQQGEFIHACAVHDGLDSDAVVGTSIVNMYGKCKSAKYARLAFEKIQNPDVIAWNAIIAVHVQHDDGESALLLFHLMIQNGIEPDAITFTSILKACDHPYYLPQGMLIHAKVVEYGLLSDIVIGNALIDMYGKCGSVLYARDIFNKMCFRDIVSWTSIIAVHSQHPQQVMNLYYRMLSTGLKPNEFTYACVLTACGNLKNIQQGLIAHHLIIETGIKPNKVLAAALIGMYGKCNKVNDARWVFNQMQNRDLVLWNAMISVYAQHGLGREALDGFDQLQQDGYKPDEITFTSVLSGCSHAGLVHEGCRIYVSMIDYGILHSMEHYGCMVDLFGRAAMLDEAEDFIESMPLKPNEVVWESFQNACIVYVNERKVAYAKPVTFPLKLKNVKKDN